MSHNRWHMPPDCPPSQLAGITQGDHNDLSPLMAQLLCNRGITEPGQVESFLAADERLLNDPFLLPDMEPAVSRICRALNEGETIAIYGDFDADGVTATTLLMEGFALLGGKVVPYIPHRTEEGYGVNDAALERLKGQQVSLVVTVDCGISAAPEVAAANRMGLDVVVTDHHTVSSEIPQAVAVVDPKRQESRYPFQELAGVGVAFKLLEALFKYMGRDADMTPYMDLVAVGTVADMVSILGENRYLVKRGLEVLHNTARAGFREMARCAGVPVSGIDTESISWVLAPRLNAAGRLDHAGIGYRVLSTTSLEEAQQLASLLEKKNVERQRITEEMLLKARQMLQVSGADAPLLMVGGKEFHSGVVGVAASRLVEEFYRPVVVFERGEQWSRGSARSIPEFNMIAALTECSDMLYKFGGHPMAAGFTVATPELEKLQQRLVKIAAEQIPAADLRPQIAVDAEVTLSSLGGTTFKQMQRLAPFGCDNPYPTFVARGVSVEQYRGVGGRGEHLKLKFRDGGMSWDGIGFRLGYLIGEVTSQMDIVFNLEEDLWRGGETLQLNILDFAPAV